MAAYLGLDLSKRSTGWALWPEGQNRPACGTWELGSELTSLGRVFLRLHQRLNEIHTVTPLTRIWYEKPLGAEAQTSDIQLAIAHGLAGHVESFGEAMQIRSDAVNIVSWRRFWLGGLPKRKRRESGSKVDLKHMAFERCRMLGISPGKHDAAEAVGILSYGLDLAGIQVPWRDEHLFQLQAAS